MFLRLISARMKAIDRHERVVAIIKFILFYHDTFIDEKEL